MNLSDAAEKKLTEFTKELEDISDQHDKARDKLHVDHQSQMAPLFEERDASLASVANFWSGVIASPFTPLAEFMNNTIDPKIVRAIKVLKVTCALKDSKLIRNVELTLLPNMFAEEGLISRSVDMDGNTVSLKGITWKKGTERARTDSLFRFFEKTDQGEQEISDIIDAFDLIYQDPFLAADDDEDDESDE